MEKELNYVVAHGPEELEHTLNEFLGKAEGDAIFKAEAHYILYELGTQKSMIKVDMSEWPVVFWHYDLLGRSATLAVKDVIARFAWEKCGEREWYCREKGLANNDNSLNLNDAYSDWRQQIFEARE